MLAYEAENYWSLEISVIYVSSAWVVHINQVAALQERNAIGY
ncbi:protein of unknown function [Burkholderia multivorans]